METAVTIETLYMPYQKDGGWYFKSVLEVGPYTSWYEAYETARQTWEHTNGQPEHRGEAPQDETSTSGTQTVVGTETAGQSRTNNQDGLSEA